MCEMEVGSSLAEHKCFHITQVGLLMGNWVLLSVMLNRLCRVPSCPQLEGVPSHGLSWSLLTEQGIH